MKAEIRNCDECQHFMTDVPEELAAGWVNVCFKGHKPRFYMPKDYLSWNWGYRRRCSDFKGRPTRNSTE